MLRIEVIDAVHSRVTEDDAQVIQNCLSYPAAFWRPQTVAINKRTGQPIKKKVRMDYMKDVFTSRRNGYKYFHTGLVPRIQQYCAEIDCPSSVLNPMSDIELDFSQPYLSDITLREDQLKLVFDACKNRRGIIQAPTGTGKTVIQMALRSAFAHYRTLILAHTKSIVEQTFAELNKHGFSNVQIIGAGHSHQRGLFGDTVVATMQSFVKIPAMERADYFEVVLVDEAHHVVRPEGVYAKILRTLLSPIRLGFTATVPTATEAVLTMEGHLGPVIGQQTIQEAAELEILAKPRIRLLKSTYSNRVHDIRRYEDVYVEGIVMNRQRNRMIAECVQDYVKEGKTVLILVTRLEHGDNLSHILNTVLGVPTEFVEGSTESDAREIVKEAMIQKEQKCVIATAVWREGINIPSLDVVINACGGKSEIMTLQAIGRGLRKTDEKDEVVIVDIFDPSHYYLVNHFGQRVTLYMDQGWM